MRVFVAGDSGILGQRLVSQVEARCHPRPVVHPEGRGLSNAKAKQELGWQLRYPSWRQGFKEELA